MRLRQRGVESCAQKKRAVRAAPARLTYSPGEYRYFFTLKKAVTVEPSFAVITAR